VKDRAGFKYRETGSSAEFLPIVLDGLTLDHGTVPLNILRSIQK
jgi:hypothetical protein